MNHWLVLFRSNTGATLAARDEDGSLLAFATEPLAVVFAERLQFYGLLAVPRECTPEDVVDLLELNDELPEDEDADPPLRVFEAQTSGPEDARRWCLELADRFVDRQAQEAA